MTPWKNFYPDVMLHVSGCPQPVVDLALQRAARDFCTQTRAWRLNLDPIRLRAGIGVYDLPLPNEGALVRLEDWADVNGNQVTLTSQQRAQFDYGDSVYTVTGQSVIVDPVPEADGILKLRASLMPSNTAAGVEDDLFANYAETIAMHAVSKLQDQPNKPYSSVAAAGNMDAYQRQVDSIKTRLWRGMTTQRPRTIKQFF